MIPSSFWTMVNNNILTRSHSALPTNLKKAASVKRKTQSWKKKYTVSKFPTGCRLELLFYGVLQHQTPPWAQPTEPSQPLWAAGCQCLRSLLKNLPSACWVHQRGLLTPCVSQGSGFAPSLSLLRCHCVTIGHRLLGLFLPALLLRGKYHLPEKAPKTQGRLIRSEPAVSRCVDADCNRAEFYLCL